MQAMIDRIGGFKAESLADRRKVPLVALQLKQPQGDCREGLRDFVRALVHW